MRSRSALICLARLPGGRCDLPPGQQSLRDAAHLHGATSIGGQWTGSYDASGSLTCRAPSSATTAPSGHLAAQIDPPVVAVYTLAALTTCMGRGSARPARRRGWPR
jgi:hypothetical protein